jgi:predicted type IV restriction endonuclease
MKLLKKLLLGAIVMILTSCASTAKFPVSIVTPAAEITAKMKQDENKNYVIEVIARNMASADRLNPPKNIYIVWIVTENNGTKNIGQLDNKNAQKLYLKTSTAFFVKEIFITAEEQGNISFPSGVEISRTTF